MRLFTVATVSHLHLAEVMISSFRSHNSGFDVSIIVPDLNSKNQNALEQIVGNDVELLVPEILGFEYTSRMRRYYSALEFCSAMKVVGLRFFLLRGEDVLFLDPDVLILDSLAEAIMNINGDVLLSPHTFKPYPTDLHAPNDLEIVRSGHINGGVVYVRNTKYAADAIDWLMTKVQRQWFVAPKLGLYADQLWLSIIPYFFHNIANFITDEGINVAYWNLHERPIRIDVNGKLLLSSGGVVRLIHLSGYDSGEVRISRHSLRRFDTSSEYALSAIIGSYRVAIGTAKQKYSHIDAGARFARGPLFFRMFFSRLLNKK